MEHLQKLTLNWVIERLQQIQNNLCHLNHIICLKCNEISSSPRAVEMNPTRNHEVAGLIPGLTQWIKDLALP